MKIDKRNPRHWAYLIVAALHAAVGLGLRAVRPYHGRQLVLLYGHKLSGNLLALYRQLENSSESDLDFAFLTLDPAYARELRSVGYRSVSALSPRFMTCLWRTGAIVTDHGLHSMSFLVRLSSIRFVDVWHGIPFKGWDADDFRLQHGYDEVWVSAPLLADIYVEHFGFRSDQVFAIGYGRTDCLIAPAATRKETAAELGLADSGQKYVLFAPTWQHELVGRSEFPFGTKADIFFDALATVLRKQRAQCLVRSHINSRLDFDPPGDVFVMTPQHEFPDTEQILSVADVLICDWSSIAFDYLVLERPTIFLDVPPPFGKDFTLGPEYRFGAVVKDLSGLCTVLNNYLTDPDAYLLHHGERVSAVRRKVYDGFDDGLASQRYAERLQSLLETG
ncbi:MAG: CDP-glycerol glycerophosphotransferase family protein [Gammaproteobacteria bacterium]